MNLPIEDAFGDILSKAQKGLGLSTEELAARTGLHEGAIRALRKGEFDERALRLVAEELGLNAVGLVEIGNGSWRPGNVEAIDGFEAVSTPFHDWQVNAFLAWDLETRQAVAFDTGTSADPLLAVLDQRNLELRAVMLTHTHRDHTQGLRALKALGDFPVFVNRREESLPSRATLIDDGFSHRVGNLEVTALETPGHTKGGTSFTIGGLAKRVAVVGDALFAGSMGGANTSYQAGLDSLYKLLALPDDTVLAPGHGPVTTVAEERAMNAFSRVSRTV